MRTLPGGTGWRGRDVVRSGEVELRLCGDAVGGVRRAVDHGGQAEADERRAGGDPEVAVEHGRAGVRDGRAGQHDERLGGAEADGGGLRRHGGDHACQACDQREAGTPAALGADWESHELPRCSGEQPLSVPMTGVPGA